MSDLPDQMSRGQAIRLSVSAPTRPECLAEAVHVLVGVYTGLTRLAALQGTARTEATVLLPETGDSGLLAGLLDQVIQEILPTGSVPVDVEVTEPQEGGLDVRLAVVPAETAIPTGAPSRPARLSGLSLGPTSGQWQATFTLGIG